MTFFELSGSLEYDDPAPPWLSSAQDQFQSGLRPPHYKERENRSCRSALFILAILTVAGRMAGS